MSDNVPAVQVQYSIVNDERFGIFGMSASPAQIKARQDAILNLMGSVMVKGIDYGTIPGCGDKPALKKPGGERIMSLFGFAPFPDVEDLSLPKDSPTIFRYRIKCRLISSSGRDLGFGIGECSTAEEKYSWKEAIPEEYDSTPEDRRRIKWKKGQSGKGYSVKQVRTNAADLSNTALKMGKKRALIDAVLTITGASAIFSQDLDDMEDDIRAAVTEEGRTHPSAEDAKAALRDPPAKAPAPKAEDGKPAAASAQAPAPADAPQDGPPEDDGWPDESDLDGPALASHLESALLALAVLRGTEAEQECERLSEFEVDDKEHAGKKKKIHARNVGQLTKNGVTGWARGVYRKAVEEIGKGKK